MNVATSSVRAWVAPAFIKLAVLYFFIGVVLGNYMGATMDFGLRTVHAHINLLGWASLALAGVIYTVYPSAANSRLAVWHFWIAAFVLPVMFVALAMFMRGAQAVGPVLGVTSAAMALAVLLFAVNVFRNVGPKPV